MGKQSIDKLSDLIKNQDGGGGLDGGGTVMDSVNSNVFTPTFGRYSKKNKNLLQKLEIAINNQHTIPETVANRPRIGLAPKKDISKLVRKKVVAKRKDGTSYITTRYVKLNPKVEQDKKHKKADLFQPVHPSSTEEPIKHDGGIVALIPPDSIKDKLFIGGGEEKDDMHITLAYIPYPWESNVVEIVKNLVSSSIIRGKLTGQVEKFGKEEDEISALVAILEIPGIDEWREQLIGSLEEKNVIVSDEFPVFRPHITLKYIEKNEDFSDKIIEPEIFNFDRLEVWDEDKKIVIKDFSEKDKWDKEIKDIEKMELVSRIQWWKINKSLLSVNEEKLSYFINAFKQN